MVLNGGGGVEKGVTFIGTLLIDTIKYIDRYPSEGTLSHIGEVSRSVGGLAANTAISLKTLAGELTVASAGLVGDDDGGRFLTEKLASYGIDVSGVRVHPTLPTSFTDVMTVRRTGVRTFFTAQGACAALGFGDVDFDSIRTTMAHVGYALLLDTLDRPDAEYATGLARVLDELSRRGVQTSLDCITEHSGRYQSIILPSLPYVDALFMNEIEAGETVGFDLSGADDMVDHERARDACALLLAYGVRRLAVIHAPQGGWAMTKSGEFVFVPSLNLPEGYIQGSVGAGDAFCAGMLYALAEGLPLGEGLRIANLAAAANLSHSNAIDGMRPLPELEAWVKTL